MVKKDTDSRPPGWSWLKEEIGKKADEKWAKTRIRSVEKIAEEAKEIALTAKSRAAATHPCMQEDDIAEIKKTLLGWGKVKLGAVISVIVIVAAGVAQHVSLKDSVEDTQAAVSEVKVTVEALETSHQTLKADMGKKDEDAEKKDKEQVAEIKQAVKQAVLEANAEKPKRRRQ